MDAEDARLAAARSQHAATIAALPTPPDAAAIEAAAASLDRVADLLPAATDADLRQLLSDLGRVIVVERGVSIRYHPEFAPLFGGEPVAVPRYGRGWRG